MRSDGLSYEPRPLATDRRVIHLEVKINDEQFEQIKTWMEQINGSK